MKVTSNKVYFYSKDEVFSNQYLFDMIVDGILFNSVEQYMMYRKAKLFNDIETMKKIIKEDIPQNQKILGRQVKYFDSGIWDDNKIGIVYTGCYNKFINTELEPIIEEYSGYEFVEASPKDTVWGIGLSIDDEDIVNEEKWRGENLLGKILTKVALEAKKIKK